MKRVAILTEDEKTFLMPTVERAISKLNGGGFNVTHLGVVPPKHGRHRGWRIPLWYLRVLGGWNTFLLASFSGLEMYRRRRAHRGGERMSLGWMELAQRAGMTECRFLGNPNHPESIEFLRSSDCDILFILVPYVLKPAALAVPKLGVINKHAAILPGCRGLFPYVWSVLHGKPLGVTFHQVTAEIDAGPVLVQSRVSRQPDSMLEFYLWVFRQFPEMALEAARQLGDAPAETAAETSGDDYFSLPTRADYERFRRAGGRIVRPADLRRSLVR